MSKNKTEAKIVEIASQGELIQFINYFSRGGGIGIEKTDDGRYFAHTLDDVVELKPAKNYLPSDFRKQIEFNPNSSQRRPAQIELNKPYRRN